MVEKEIKRYRHIRYDTSREEIYKKIAKDFGVNNTKIYLTALAIGFSEGDNERFRSKARDIRYFDELHDDAKWLIKSIAIAHTGDIGVLLRGNEMLDINDEYANAGIKILNAILYSKHPGTPVKKFEEQIREKFKNLNII